MICYLDTHVALWLAGGTLDRITDRAQQVLREADLLLAPTAMLEMQYLFEIERVKLPARDVLLKLGHEIDLRLCDLPFSQVIDAALGEGWTRDPFDRLIVAQAKANGFATLITADTRIREHYLKALW